MVTSLPPGWSIPTQARMALQMAEGPEPWCAAYVNNIIQTSGRRAGKNTMALGPKQKRMKQLKAEDQKNPTMHDIRKLEYALGNWRDELLYVERIAAEAGVPVETLRPMEELFGGMGAVAKPTRQVINEKFFVWVEREKPQYPGFDRARRLTDAHMKVLNSVLQLGAQREINALKQNIISGRQNIKNYEEHILSQFRQLGEYEERLTLSETKIKSAGRDFAADIEKIVADGQVCLAPATEQSGTGKSVVFITRPLSVPYFNKEAGIETVIPFGQFRIEIFWNERGFTTACRGWKGNLTISGHSHPHVDSGGSICFGTNLSKYNNAAARHDLAACLQIIIQTLGHFTPGQGTTYVSIPQFMDLARIARRDGLSGKKIGGYEDEDEEEYFEEDTDDPIVATPVPQQPIPTQYEVRAREENGRVTYEMNYEATGAAGMGGAQGGGVDQQQRRMDQGLYRG